MIIIAKSLLNLIHFSAQAFESYLLNRPFFVMLNSTSYEQLSVPTRGRHIIGRRKIEQFAIIGWAVSLDSGDELLSLIKSSAYPLTQVPVETKFNRR